MVYKNTENNIVTWYSVHNQLHENQSIKLTFLTAKGDKFTQIVNTGPMKILWFFRNPSNSNRRGMWQRNGENHWDLQNSRLLTYV